MNDHEIKASPAGTPPVGCGVSCPCGWEETVATPEEGREALAYHEREAHWQEGPRVPRYCEPLGAACRSCGAAWGEPCVEGDAVAKVHRVQRGLVEVFHAVRVLDACGPRRAAELADLREQSVAEGVDPWAVEAVEAVRQLREVLDVPETVERSPESCDLLVRYVRRKVEGFARFVEKIDGYEEAVGRLAESAGATVKGGEVVDDAGLFVGTPWEWLSWRFGPEAEAIGAELDARAMLEATVGDLAESETAEAEATGGCPCGADDWETSATLIACRSCGRTWGRCEGRWVFDTTTEPVEDRLERLEASEARLMATVYPDDDGGTS